MGAKTLYCNEKLKDKAIELANGEMEVVVDNTISDDEWFIVEKTLDKV